MIIQKCQMQRNNCTIQTICALGCELQMLFSAKNKEKMGKIKIYEKSNNLLLTIVYVHGNITFVAEMSTRNYKNLCKKVIDTERQNMIFCQSYFVRRSKKRIMNIDK